LGSPESISAGPDAPLPVAGRFLPARDRPPGSAARRLARGTLLYGGLLSAAFLLVIAPYLGHRAFTLFRRGGPLVAKHYAAAIYWSPLQSDYRAALAEAVLAGRAKNPADLRAGFLTVADAIALKPIDPGYYLIRARLARQAFLAGPGETDWIAMADRDYTRAARLDPFRPQARLERGWMFESIGNHEVAREEAEAALRSEPNSFEARRLRAVALLDLGRLEEARREAAEARRSHQGLARFVPSNPYEAQVLMWDEAGWAELEVKLAKQDP
jgi:tetratricopeptide (TPR) repeat protein